MYGNFCSWRLFFGDLADSLFVAATCADFNFVVGDHKNLTIFLGFDCPLHRLGYGIVAGRFKVDDG